MSIAYNVSFLYRYLFYFLSFIEEIEVELQNEKDLDDLGLEVKTVRNQVDIEEANQEIDEGVVRDLKNVTEGIGIVDHIVGNEIIEGIVILCFFVYVKKYLL